MHKLIAVTDRPAPYPYFSRGVVRQQRQAWQLGEFRSYDQAVHAFTALQDVELPKGITHLAVRSSDDPQWEKTPEPNPYRDGEKEIVQTLKYPARRAADEWADKKVSEAVHWAIREHGTLSFDRVQRYVEAEVERVMARWPGWDGQQALKDRVLVGRCHGCNRAWWMPKKQGPLHGTKCFTCGSPLHQTTLSLRRIFHRLPVKVEEGAGV